MVYTAQPTPRTRYACRVLFESILGLEVEVTTNWPRFLSEDLPKITYGKSTESAALPWLPAARLLQETGIQHQTFEVQTYRQLPAACFVPGSDSALLPFDLLSFTFLLATRYEEYLPFHADAHGRFPATESLAHQHGFLQRPILQEWGKLLLDQLQRFFPGLPDNRPVYQFQPTYDIDMAWAYRHRPLWLQLAGFGKDILYGNRHLIKERLLVLFRQTTDPFYTFDRLDALHKAYGLSPIFFLLLGDYGPYDKNLPPDGQAMQTLIESLSQHNKTGLHPSYRSNGHPHLLQAEIQRYARLTGQHPLRSRQHFLKLSFPATYRQLIAAGIREDYTMGYADAIGFRAGLSVPFPWYDLEVESEQPLTLYPFVLMDVTLKQYLQLTPDQAIETLQSLIDKVRRTGGLFMPLWHNSSFADSHGWTGWDEVHRALLQYGSTKS